MYANHSINYYCVIDEATDNEIEEVLRAAMKGRKRVKDQLLRIDSTYPAVRFTYRMQNGEERAVRTLEEDEYPHAYHRKVIHSDELVPAEPAQSELQMGVPPVDLRPEPAAPTKPTITLDEVRMKEQHLVFQENQKGVSFDKLFGPYLAGATRVTVADRLSAVVSSAAQPHGTAGGNHQGGLIQ